MSSSEFAQSSHPVTFGSYVIKHVDTSNPSLWRVPMPQGLNRDPSAPVDIQPLRKLVEKHSISMRGLREHFEK